MPVTRRHDLTDTQWIQAEPPGGSGTAEPANHALGRSRGGLTTKLHPASEQGRKPGRPTTSVESTWNPGGPG
jgi:hypothetical protein